MTEIEQGKRVAEETHRRQQRVSEANNRFGIDMHRVKRDRTAKGYDLWEMAHQLGILVTDYSDYEHLCRPCPEGVARSIKRVLDYE